MMKLRQKTGATSRRWLTFLMGMVNANILAAALLQVFARLPGSVDGFYSSSATVVVPLLMGVISAYFWRDLKLSGWQLFFASLANTVIGMILCSVFLGEGAVCLMMASPLLLVLVCLGASIGNALFKAKPGALQVSVVPILFAFLLADSLFPHQNESSTTTEMRVNAPPSVVFSHIAAFPQIAEPSDFWFSRFGLPYPIETTADGTYTGATRICRFSGGVEMRERITAVVPNQSMDLDITEMPKYPEIADHVTIEHGRIALRDNGDGTTTLVGTTWYSLRVFPTLYFGPWSDYILHVGGNRVFAQIKRLSEADVAHGTAHR